MCAWCTFVRRLAFAERTHLLLCSCAVRMLGSDAVNMQTSVLRHRSLRRVIMPALGSEAVDSYTKDIASFAEGLLVCGRPAVCISGACMLVICCGMSVCVCFSCGHLHCQRTSLRWARHTMLCRALACSTRARTACILLSFCYQPEHSSTHHLQHCAF